MEDSEFPERVTGFQESAWEDKPAMRHSRPMISSLPPSGGAAKTLFADEPRAARRFADLEQLWPSAPVEKPVAIILSKTPAPLNWGWFSREDQRMHLQTVNRENQHGAKEYRAWLETNGNWGVVWDKKPPVAKDVKLVEKAINESREEIEVLWAAFMIDKGWLQAHMNGQDLVVVAYPNTSGKFQRTIDLSKLFPGAADTPSDGDIGLDAENSSIVIWKKRPAARQQHVQLAGHLWR